MSKKVFIGVNNIAGVAINLVEGFKQINVEADFYSAEKEYHQYNYPEGINPRKIPYHKNEVVRKVLLFFFMIKLLIRYKYFIFLQAGWTLMTGFKDIRILRFFGKKTMVIFTGCDARIPEMVKHIDWNPCAQCPIDYQKSVNCDIPRKKMMIPLIEKWFQFIVSPDMYAGFLKKKHFPIFFPRVINNFKPVYPDLSPLSTIRILHAPTNDHYKGTKYIRSAIYQLKEKYDNILFNEVKGLSIIELYKAIEKCDLVIDQMLGGYGMLGVESMAMGKPVIANMNPEMFNDYEHFCPVINANPDTLFNVLESIIINPAQLHEIGIKSRKFVEKYHDASIVAEELFRILES